jgi:hypothetical protein
MLRTTLATTALALVGALSACHGPAASPPGTPSSPPTGAATSLQLCQAAVSGGQLVSWASGSVAQFRQYQYGGPTPTRPLATAFPDLPGETVGAWCGVGDGPDTVHWWAVVSGREPAKAIDITGPGEGKMRGEAQGPPIVP